MGFRILALIPARSGSRGLRHKNLQRLGGEPLLARATRLARQCSRLGETWRVVVDTDSTHYAAVARRAGAEVPFLRPRALATSRARLIDVVLHAVAKFERLGSRFDAVVLLSATTPLTMPADVRRGLRLFRRTRQAVVSVVRDQVPDAWRFIIERNCLVTRGRSPRIGRRQEGPQHYRLNGALFVAAPEWLRRHRQFFVSGKTLPLVMPRERSLDIEDEIDLALARFLVSRNSKEKRRLI